MKMTPISWQRPCTAMASDEDDLLAQQAIALEHGGLQRVDEAAIAFAVQVLDRELISLLLVGTLFGIGAGQGQVEAEGDRVASWGVAEFLRIGAAGKEQRHRARGQNAGKATAQNAATAEDLRV